MRHLIILFIIPVVFSASLRDKRRIYSYNEFFNDNFQGYTPDNPCLRRYLPPDDEFECITTTPKVITTTPKEEKTTTPKEEKTTTPKKEKTTTPKEEKTTTPKKEKTTTPKEEKTTTPKEEKTTTPIIITTTPTVPPTKSPTPYRYKRPDNPFDREEVIVTGYTRRTTPPTPPPVTRAYNYTYTPSNVTYSIMNMTREMIMMNFTVPTSTPGLPYLPPCRFLYLPPDGSQTTDDFLAPCTTWASNHTTTTPKTPGRKYLPSEDKNDNDIPLEPPFIVLKG